MNNFPATKSHPRSTFWKPIFRWNWAYGLLSASSKFWPLKAQIEHFSLCRQMWQSTPRVLLKFGQKTFTFSFSTLRRKGLQNTFCTLTGQEPINSRVLPRLFGSVRPLADIFKKSNCWSDPEWSNMIQNDPIKSRMIQYNPEWCNMIQNNPTWSTTIHYGPK